MKLGCGLDIPEFKSQEGVFFSKMSGSAKGPTHSPILWVQGSFLGVKWSGQMATHSPTCSAEVKNEWSCTSAPPVCILLFFHVGDGFLEFTEKQSH